MAVTASRSIKIIFSGDVVSTLTESAASSTDSPGTVQLVTLASGANTITPPTGGSTPVAVTIHPPAGNTDTILLKGVTGDTGISLHKTDPTSIGLFNPTGTFVLTAGAQIEGVRLIWT